MADSSRRTFLKQSATAVSALAVGRCAGPDGSTTAPLDAEHLNAVADAVLPSELGDAGIERVVAEFRNWLTAYEPVAELSHGYGTSEIRYGPPHPAPRWAAQLDALELEAGNRHGRSFAALPVEDRRALIRRQIGRDGSDRLPDAAESDNVAVGLLAYYYATPPATDLCYRASIGKETCRDLENVGAQPAPLAEGA